MAICIVIIVFLLLVTAILISVIQEWNKRWRELEDKVNKKINETKNSNFTTDRVSIINFEYVRDMMNIIKRG
ncbi:hypothetical protein BU100_07120 [Staphylococcus xylosus]|uniref:hypothetical protein n=1 Tax=Staphylococcus xylosus TaxID=1288 RepID=UPI000E696ADF|nr:hypothetical protein [Staphylococcus xylosus]RIM94767.1 hypothetical protein BU100_07120 [Staphylococcus xylosus]